MQCQGAPQYWSELTATSRFKSLLQQRSGQQSIILSLSFRAGTDRVTCIFDDEETGSGLKHSTPLKASALQQQSPQPSAQSLTSNGVQESNKTATTPIGTESHKSRLQSTEAEGGLKDDATSADSKENTSGRRALSSEKSTATAAEPATDDRETLTHDESRPSPTNQGNSTVPVTDMRHTNLQLHVLSMAN